MNKKDMDRAMFQESTQLYWELFNNYPSTTLDQDDIRLNTIKRFEKAVFELTQMDKKTLILRDGGDKFSFR
jgi:hypothetical protein